MIVDSHRHAQCLQELLRSGVKPVRTMRVDHVYLVDALGIDVLEIDYGQMVAIEHEKIAHTPRQGIAKHHTAGGIEPRQRILRRERIKVHIAVCNSDLHCPSISQHF